MSAICRMQKAMSSCMVRPSPITSDLASWDRTLSSTGAGQTLIIGRSAGTKCPTRMRYCTVVPGGTTASAMSLLICCTQPVRGAVTTTASAGAVSSTSSSGSLPRRGPGHIASTTTIV